LRGSLLLGSNGRAQRLEALSHLGSVRRLRIALEVLLEELDRARRLTRALERDARVVEERAERLGLVRASIRRGLLEARL
jgi:hypothetical protein